MSNSPLLVALVALGLGACQKNTEVATPRATVEAIKTTAPAPAPEPMPAPQALPAGHPGALPAGHPSIDPNAAPGSMPPAPGGNPMAAQVAAETGVPLPLPLEGAGSIAELKARLALVTDEAVKPALEEAFRKTFTVDRPSRDKARARELLDPLATSTNAKVASLALRTLAYVAINDGFDTATAKLDYEKALVLDPDYGETHYALAFVLAMNDRTTGKVHFDRAMALGVPDTRNLRSQFYGGDSH